MLFAIEGVGLSAAPPQRHHGKGPAERVAGPALRPLPPGAAMPAWCDRHLPAARRDALGGRAWYDSTLAAGLPDGAEPILGLCAAEAVMVPLMRLDGRLQSMTTPYSLGWRPLAAGRADDETMQAAGRDLGRLLRGGPPALLDCLAQEEPGLEAFIRGLRAAGLVPLRFVHFGNWHEAVAAEDGWDGYLSDRASALQSTIRRKTPRCLKRARFEWITEPGPRLEEGIAAYEAVRARSWKPFEPAPAFDGTLMRALAAEGTLRLGVLRLRDGGVPVAAQYWAVSGGRAVVLKLAHDEAQRDLSPGTVLTALMMADILDGDGTVHEVDFGRGDDPYKRLWAGQRRQRLGLLVADPRHPAGLAAIGRHAAGLLRRTARQWWEARPWGRRGER